MILRFIDTFDKFTVTVMLSFTLTPFRSSVFSRTNILGWAIISLSALSLITIPSSANAQLLAPYPFRETERVEVEGYPYQADVIYGHKDGMALSYDVLHPKENQAKGVGLLFMVSGGWVSTWTPPEKSIDFLEWVVDEGYTVFLVRHGSSPRYLVPDAVEDVRMALQHIFSNAAKFQVDPNRLGVFGFSAGGHLALSLGTTTNHKEDGDPRAPRVAAVVAVYPPTDLRPYITEGNPLKEPYPALKFEADKVDQVSPLLQVTSDDAPTLLVHGDQDELVPIWHSEKILEAFQEAGVDSKLVTIEGAAHGFDEKGNEVLRKEFLNWFGRLLESSSSE